MSSSPFTLRLARWPEDLPRVAALVTTYTTDHIYCLHRTGFSFTLYPEPVDPPLQTDYGDVTEDSRLTELEFALLAETPEGVLAGFAAGDYTAWNRRAALWHLYVAPGYRGQGVGQALLAEMDAFARAAGARCLWLETQNTNYPAIRFYLRMGFQLCGLDLSLYDPTGPARHEIPLFFSREVKPPEILSSLALSPAAPRSC